MQTLCVYLIGVRLMIFVRLNIEKSLPIN